MLETRTKDIVRLQMTGPRGRGVTGEVILGAETRLGIKLPDSYKDFLKEFGWGDRTS